MESGEVYIALSNFVQQLRVPRLKTHIFATDGLFPIQQYGYQCTHTSGELNPWRSIDLQDKLKIKKIVLVNTQDVWPNL